MTDKKLTLQTRKDLRDNEEKKKEHLARIEGLTGKSGLEFSIKDDIHVAETLAKNGYTDRLGEICYGSYLGQLASALDKLCKDAAAKSALSGTWTSNKIYFELDEKAEGLQRQQITFVGGDLRIACKSSMLWCSMGELGDDLPDRLTSQVAGATLPLKSAQDIRMHEEKAAVHLAAIGAAIGRTGPVTYVVEDVKAIDEALAARKYTHRTGEIIWDSYLKQLAQKLTSLCQDAMVKEAIGDMFKGNLVFKLDPTVGSYTVCKFVGGNLVMSCKADTVWNNLGELGNDIEKQL